MTSRVSTGALALAALLPALLSYSPMWPPLNGDEPHYVLMATSLLRDGDFEMASDPHWPLPAWVSPVPLQPHTKPGASEGRAYSVHGYGLAFAIAPALALDPWPPLGLRLLGSLVLLAFGLALRRSTASLAPQCPASVVAALAMTTLPLLFNAPRVYPDLLAATAAIWAWVLIDANRGTGRLLLAGVMVAGLPWLHYKFLPLWALIVARAVIRLRGTRSIVVAIAAALGPISLAAFNDHAFGSPSPMAGAPLPVAALAQTVPLMHYIGDPLGALRTAAGLLLDQKDGLLMFAPHYLLGVAGAAWLWRRQRAELLWLLCFGAAVWAPAALSQNTGLWGPPARWILGGIAPLAVLAGVGATAPSANRSLRRWRGALLGGGAALTLVYTYWPPLAFVDRGNTRAPLLQQLGGPGLEIWEWFPLWTRIGESPQWAATLLWSAALIVAALHLWRSAGDTDEATNPAPPVDVVWLVAALVLGLAMVAGTAQLVPVSGPEVTVVRDYPEARVSVARVPRSRAWPQPSAIWFGGDDTSEVWLSTETPIDTLLVETGAASPVLVTLDAGDTREILQLDAEQPRRLSLQPTGVRQWRDRWYLRLRLNVRGGVLASQAGGSAEDTRLLGAYVRLLHEP